MVKFMILAAPRSGTTWAANWMQAEGEPCLHDPFMDDAMTPEVLDSVWSGGISCTGSVMAHHDWVWNHPAPKVILHRNFREINRSLGNIGLPSIDPVLWEPELYGTQGMHAPYTELFNWVWARRIFIALVGREPDRALHGRLRTMNVQPSEEVLKAVRLMWAMEQLNAR